MADFKQYHASEGSTPVLGTGNGYLYRIAPVLTPSLSGSVAKVYDAGSTATLAQANYSLAGAIDGDTVALAGAASYDSRHVGAGKLVSVSGLTIDHASNGAVAVYGYSLGSTQASGSIGTITAAPLSIAASSQSKVYDAGTASSATAIVSGLAGSDSVSALTQRFDSANAGARTLAVTGYAVNDGNGGQNYVVTTRTAAGTITPAPLVIGAASESKVYDASNRSSATPGLVSGLQGSDSVGLARPGLRQQERRIENARSHRLRRQRRQRRTQLCGDHANGPRQHRPGAADARRGRRCQGLRRQRQLDRDPGRHLRPARRRLGRRADPGLRQQERRREDARRERLRDQRRQPRRQLPGLDAGRRRAIAPAP